MNDFQILLTINADNREANTAELLDLLQERKEPAVDFEALKKDAVPGSLSSPGLDMVIEFILYLHLLKKGTKDLPKIAENIFKVIKIFFEYKKKLGEFSGKEEVATIVIKKKKGETRVELRHFNEQEKKALADLFAEIQDQDGAAL